MPPKPKKRPARAPVDERIRVRDALLPLASARLAEAFHRCTDLMPVEDIAFYVVGDAKGVSDVAGGHRDAIADLLRGRASEAVIEEIRGYLAKREPGFIPCLFCIGLASGGVDVSVVALRMEMDRDELQ